MEEEKEIGNRDARHCPPDELGGGPWLVYPNGYSMKSHTFCNIFEPKKTCIKRIPEMRRKICQESSHGWLVLLDMFSGGCSLWNPISLETVHLPDFKWRHDDDDFDLLTVTLSSAPTEPGCMVLFFCGNNMIIYCQPGDTQWTTQTYKIDDGFAGCIKHAIGFSDGTIYAWTHQDYTFIINKESSGCLSFKLLDVKVPQSPPGTIRSSAYPFESCGEWFRVFLYSSGTGAIKSMEVYKLDFSQMTWVKAEGLGGQAFFFTDDGRSSGSCSADQHSGLTADCIYFTRSEDKNLYVFDVKDDSISVSLPCPDLQRPWGWGDPFWFIPMTNNRMVDTAKQNERRNIIDDRKIMVKQSLKEMSKEEEKIETIESLFFNLPKELQLWIPTLLTSVVDYMNFRAACKPFRSIAPPVQWRSPWLTVIQKGVSFFLDPECNSIYRLNTPELFDAILRFSKDGWLLMSEGKYSMFFFDPFTKTRIELPDMIEPYSFDGICFSSLPTSSDCVIFGIGLCTPDCLLIGWHRLGQENWSYHEITIGGENELFSLSRNNPVFYDGAFYCLSHEGRLGVFDVNEKWTILLNSQLRSSTSENFMVECDGELLSVFLDDGGNSTIVSKLDRSVMDWVRVKSLSDRMLFLSSSTSIAMETQEKKLQNKIFLPRVWNKKNNDVVFYSLETEKYHSFSSSSFSRNDYYGTKEQFYCSWSQPNLVWMDIP